MRWRFVSGALVIFAASAGVWAASSRTGAAESPEKDVADVAAIVSLEAVKKRAAQKNYEAARWDPIHFEPAIGKASDEACLVCHRETLDKKPRQQSPAGMKASEALAWYQTLDTYSGPQEGFHWRHISSPFAKQVMNLNCNFCHKGNDPREEAPGSSATTTRATLGDFTLRKMVNPNETCLRCHGSFPYQNMEGLSGPWHEIRQDMEPEGTANGCLTCHEQMFRTNRHKVTYLNGEAIEALAKTSSDVCYGCHGGRQWYRISYPYPRNPWPDMPAETPEWAKNRPTQSEAQHRK